MESHLDIFEDRIRFNTTAHYDASLVTALKERGFRYVKYGWETNHETGHFWFKETKSDEDRVFALREALNRDWTYAVEFGFSAHVDKLKADNNLKALVGKRHLLRAIGASLNFDECGIDRRQGETGIQYATRIAHHYKRHAQRVDWQYTPDAEALLSNPQEIVEFFQIG